VIWSFTNSAASASWGPPISPIIITASVSRSCSNRARMSTNELPLIGSPPMPTLVVIPTPSACICDASSYPSVPERVTTPTERRGDENQARRRARVRDRFLHGVEDRPSQMLAAALPRGDAAHDVRAVRDHLPGVEGALVPGKALDNDARLLVEQDAHVGFVVG